MADLKFSELAALVGTPDDDSLIALSEDDGMSNFSSVKMTLAQLKSLLGSANSGTYTPVPTLDSNVDSATPTEAQWSRVGNIITISGAVSIDQTATGSFQVSFNLPIASDFVAVTDANGCMTTNANTGSNAAGGIIQADPSTDKWVIKGFTMITSAVTWKYIFQYKVL